MGFLEFMGDNLVATIGSVALVALVVYSFTLGGKKGKDGGNSDKKE